MLNSPTKHLFYGGMMGDAHLGRFPSRQTLQGR